MLLNVSNPLRIDPTRTVTLRRQFQAEITRRYRALADDIWKAIVEEDGFGLSPQRVSGGMVGNSLTANQQWIGTTPQQIEGFERWLRERVQLRLTGSEAEASLASFIQQAYGRGVRRGYDDVGQPQAIASQTGPQGTGATVRETFARTVLGSQQAGERASLLVKTGLTGLRGVADAHTATIVQLVTNGLAQGNSPTAIADEIYKATGISRNRANRIARTEVIRAHGEGQLEAFEALNIESVGVNPEWVTATGACPLCASLRNVVLKVSEARGLIPRHPNCRCAWKPALAAQKEKGQVRDKASIERAIKASVEAAKGKGNWPGGSRPITKDRSPSEPRRTGLALPNVPQPQLPFAKADEARVWAENNVRTQGEITESDRRSVKYYTSMTDANFRRMNGTLRAGKTLEGEDKTQGDRLINLINRTTVQEDIVAVRAMNHFRSGAAFRKGQVYSDKGFVSTSVRKGLAEEVFGEGSQTNKTVMEILIPAGSKGYFVHGTSEGEIILPPGSRFVVESVTRKGWLSWLGIGRTHVRLRLLTPTTINIVASNKPTDLTTNKTQTELVREKYSWNRSDLILERNQVFRKFKGGK